MSTLSFAFLYFLKITSSLIILVLFVLERACMFQVSDLKEQHFLEFSATKLRELQSEYQNLTTPCTGSTDADSSGHFFSTPKLQKLLSVLKEDRNSKYGENELQLATFLILNFLLHFLNINLFISLINYMNYLFYVAVYIYCLLIF